MYFSKNLSFFLGLAATAIASPMSDVAPRADTAELESRQTASGCTYFAAPRCCVPTVCQCRDGKIYQVNQDAVNAGRHGCDPPWGYIADSNSQFPGYCCREAEGQASQGITGEEALAYLKGTNRA